MNTSSSPDHKAIRTWLLIGVIMVLVQIMVGGITRLTGSGLSITRWDIVTGILPPFNLSQWMEEFKLYKQTPQYQRINEGMSLSQFKFIFFWEYVHRLWARIMGFVFIIPFFIFLVRKSLSPKLIKRLLVVVLLAGLAAIFGWIMVASGLVNRPWVNAYKLTLHLSLGIALFMYLFFTFLSYRGYKTYPLHERWKNAVIVLIILVIIQIAFGGFVSGMKSALNYPTWPSMNGEWIPDIVTDQSHWNMDNLLLYDQSGFMPALVQVIHRYLAYVIGIAMIVFAFRWYRQALPSWRWISFVAVGIIVVQVLLGILTLVNSKGSIPVSFGALHQVFGILLLTFLVYIQRVIRPRRIA